MKKRQTVLILVLLIPFIFAACEPTIEKVESMTNQKKLAKIGRTASNGDVRLAAVMKLTDQKALFDIASSEISLSDPEEGASKLTVCIAAAENLTDKSYALALAKNKFLNSEIRVAALHNLKDPAVLDKLITNYYNIGEEAENALVSRIEAMTDPEKLTRAATRLSNETARLAAVERITDQKILAGIAENDLAQEVRNAAFEKLSDPVLLAEFAMNSTDASLGVAAVKKISDQKLLLDVALVDEVDYLVRREA
ncbi:MAG: hypothetical protein GY859_11260, partial [Desulfobacterales bacterium]|nr:hypothetical protein [Desulfobacterales bacterium]